MDKMDIKSLNLEELTSFLEENGEKKFRAKQLYEWMHVHLADHYGQMTNLPKALIEKLEQNTEYTALKVVEHKISALDGTEKYLFSLKDGQMVESVLMRYSFGNSVCISSQVGCRMGCRFCASTIGGLIRSLTPSEMLDQVYRIQKESQERVSHVVVMGTGEPLDNFDNLVRFIELLSDENGLNISQRNITVSTCGIVPKIEELADLNLQITLAISLHASTQEKRMALMPVANKYEIDELLEVCRYYFKKTKRRMTFEYSLVGGVNDTDEDAKKLSQLLKTFPCHVNLIPVNPVVETKFKEPDSRAVSAFKNKLEKNGINVTIRREMGRDIDGACGQLRRRYMKGGATCDSTP